MLAVPGAVAVLLGEPAMGVRFVAGALGLVALWAGARRLATVHRLQANEGLAVVALAFLLASAAASWPLTAAGLAPVDALFEAVSAVTTTGLTTQASVEAQGPAFLFARSWLQWYGGLLIVVLALALLIEPGAVARRLAGDLEPEDLIGSTRLQARRSAVIYLGFTLAGIVALGALGVDPLAAVAHVLSAVSTGGFSTYDDSIAGLDGVAARAVVSVLCLLGAVSFVVHYRLLTGDRRAAWRDGGAAMLLAACAIGAGVTALGLVIVDGYGWGEALYHGPLLAISAQTTAGFESTPAAALSPAVQLALILAMAIGGQAGSSAGGIKLFRFRILVQLAKLQVLRPGAGPHAVLWPTLGGHRVDALDVRNAAGTAALFAVTVVGGWLVFLVHGHPPMAALFDVASATFTVGMSAGVVGPDLAPALKLMVCALMLLGRLEIVALVVLLSPRSWWRREARGR